MTEAERGRLAEVRRLIFQNLANRVPMASVMGAFRLSEKEVMDHFRFVARCITEYRFKRAMPLHQLHGVEDAALGRLVFFGTLAKIGPIALTSDHKLSEVKTSTIKDAYDAGAISAIANKQGRA